MTITLLCWVLKTPIDQAFPVDIEPDKLWGHVKKAIMEEKKNEFAGTDANTLKLWKGLCQRIPDDHVNIIIVQRPTHIKGSIVDELELLRTHFWGQNRTTFIQSSTAEIIDLSSVNYSRLNPLFVKVLLVREEYHIAYDDIIAKTIMQADRIIILMTGQPGIGKTFSSFPSTPRAENCHPSDYEFVVFDQSGVRLCSTAAVETFQIPQGIWTLSGSYSKLQLDPCTPVQSSRAHLLHTSSPSSSRWQEWVKQLGAEMYVMDIWSREELGVLLTVDSAHGLTLFDKYGSDIRVIVRILRNPTQEDMYADQVEVAAASVVHEFSAAFQGFLKLDFGSKEVSSKIFTLRPKDSISRNEPTLTIQTELLLKSFGPGSVP